MKKTTQWRMLGIGLISALVTFGPHIAFADGPPVDGMGLYPGQEDGARPRLTAYLPDKNKATGSAFIVCPGGGYRGLAGHEAAPIAQWLNTLGITSFVLEYRHAPEFQHPVPLQDATRAMRIVRAHANEWGLNPDKIGILGFSAGGHLASSLATHFDAGNPDAQDPIERVRSRPDAAVLVYPVISLVADCTHKGSRNALLGPDPDPELVRYMSSELQVTPETPPTFLMHTVADTVVPYENSLLFAAALRKAGVSHEMHIYEPGQHGYALGQGHPILSSWPGRCADWLHAHGF
jgi:acetyl esterase/lipase